jgi:TonB-dependent receptor-like protein
MVRGSGFTFDQPIVGVGTAHPSTRGYNKEASGQTYGSLIHTSKSMVNELKGGYTFFMASPGQLVPGIVPNVVLAGGFNIGRTTSGLLASNKTLSVRYDLTLFRGRHELKMGGDFFHPSNRLYYDMYVYGSLDATLGPVPANIGELFPVWNDPSTWNLAPLSSITRNYTQAFGQFDISCADSPKTCRRRRPDAGAWFQDNWTVTSALTLNLGIRWDFSLDGMGQDFVYPFVPVYPQLPRIHEKTPQEWANFGPRLGGAYALNEKTVLRGGWGLYFAGVTYRNAHASFINTATTTFQVLNDGRPNFAADPFNLAGGGKVPTFDDAQAQARGQLRGTGSIIYDGKTTYSYQTSGGIQHQLRPTLAVQADYVWLAGRREPASRNINLSFDPATGVNFPFTDVSHRPYPQFGAINVWTDSSYSNYHALETAVTKRFSDRWQAAATYTLSWTYNYYPEPINPRCVGPINGLTMTCDTYFKVQPDLGGVYSLRGAGGIFNLTEPDQRHRLVLNGMYELPGGFQVSGLYLYSSGIRQQSSYGVDLRDFGTALVFQEYGAGRLRRDGTVIPHNSVLDDPIHRVDLRLQWRLRAGRASIMPLVEVFNLFNNTNFTRNWVELNPQYGRPTGQSAGNGYRVVQLGVRTTF